MADIITYLVIAARSIRSHLNNLDACSHCGDARLYVQRRRGSDERQNRPCVRRCVRDWRVDTGG